MTNYMHGILRVNWKNVRFSEAQVGAGSEAESGRSAVDVSPVGDLDDVDDQNVILNLVQDSVVALSDSVFLLCAELLASRGTRIVGKGLNPGHDPS
jgi:hypothetical protein